jgi:hypothetical protein
VVFSVETGKILHVHTEASLMGEPVQRSREEILALSREIGETVAGDLDVLEIEHDILRQRDLGREAYVDVEQRLLRERAVEQRG